MSEADIFCGIAEQSHIPAELTRMALECAARLSGWSAVQVPKLTGCVEASRARVPETLETHDLELAVQIGKCYCKILEVIRYYKKRVISPFQG